MARQVLPWVGAAVGFWLGGPAGAQLGFAIGGVVGNAVDPQVIKGPKLGEGQDNTASEGGYRPIVLGKGAVGACMLHEGPMIKRTIRHRQSKGGGPVTEEERAYRTMAFGLGESADPGTGVALTRLWIDNVLRYDVTPTSQIVAESMEFADEFTFYPGNLTQQPDPDIEAFMGVGNVPAYPGSPYIVFPHYDVTDSRGRAPLIKAELASSFVAPTKAYALSGALNLIFSTPDPMQWGSGSISPISSPSTIFAGNGGVTVTSNSAAVVTFNDVNWTSISGLPYTVPPGGSGLYCEASSRWVVAVGVDSGASSARIYYSSDGINYVPSSAPWPQFGVATPPCACRGQTILFGGQSGNVWRSTNGGVSFSYANLWMGPNAIAGMLATDVGFVVVRSNGAAYFSATGESGTWGEIYSSGTFSPDIGGVAFDADRNIAVMVADDGLAYYSTNGGTVWQAGTNHGLHSVFFTNGSNNLTVIDGWFLIAGTSSTNGPIKAIQHPTDSEWITVKNPQASGEIRGLVSTSGATSADKIALWHVVQWCHERVGAGSYNVSDLTDEVEGVVFGDGYTAADAIRTLMALYFFDAGEYDGGAGYRINYVKRGKPAVMTLTDDDIVDGPEDWEREDSYERPRVLHVAYQNPIADYGAPNIVIKRTSPDVKVVGERSISVPVVFSDVDEITQRSDILMTVVYTEIAGKYEIVLPDSLLNLSPTDSIGFSIRGRTRRLRMVSWRYSPDGTIKTEWMSDRQSSYTSNVTGLPVAPTRPPPPSIVGPTISAALDIPALVDSLDGLHLVLAASGQTEAWYGADHQRKLEAETDFTTVLRFNQPTTIMGVLQGTVTTASPHFTDTTNVVRVKLYSDDELVTHTQQQFLSEQGAFALAWDDGGTRRWELLQYRDAIKVGDSEWELTTLARGRLNTTAAEHPSGSLFVLLDAGIRAVPMQSGWIGMDITHRAVSLGQAPESAAPYVEEYTGQSQVEFPVAHLFIERDGDDINCLTVPRNRFGTDDAPMRSLNWEGYLWTATDGSNTASATTTTDTHTFDVTGWASPVTVTVAQLNRITGAGPAVSETINT